MAKRLEILKGSLVKKQKLFDDKLQSHFADVKQANGQPLNDKRNGQATLNRWDKQNNSLRKVQEEIEKTKSAIEYEEGTIRGVEAAKEVLPDAILQLIETGELIQWRKHPHTLFVNGVDKARIIWDRRKKRVAHKFANAITDKEQYKKFAGLYNSLCRTLNN